MPRPVGCRGIYCFNYESRECFRRCRKTVTVQISSEFRFDVDMILMIPVFGIRIKGEVNSYVRLDYMYSNAMTSACNLRKLHDLQILITGGIRVNFFKERPVYYDWA